MLTPQQQEALTYFSHAAGEWRKKAEGKVPKFNVIAARNAFVVASARAMGVKGHALDVGCGTGELAIALVREGYVATGIDFTPDMIRLAKEKAAAERATVAEFVCASIFDYDPPNASFDLIAANGFIEYISSEELVTFLGRARRMMRKGGALIVGSRNRLFNAFSLNAFTAMERGCGALPHLMQEAVHIAEAKDMTALIDALASSQIALPRHGSHPGTTGISVSVRHQYTPGELVRLFREHGFAVRELHPVHYHAIPPRFKDAHPSIHTDLATLFQNFATMELLPFSSSFMVRAEPA